MNVLACVLYFVSVCALCSAHLCLIEPKQRGSIKNLNMAGSDDCILLKGPCGGRASDSLTIWKASGNFSVIFQKNLDHWAKATPGYFTVSIISNGAVTELTRVPDMGEKSLSLYTASGSLGAAQKGNYMLQVTYVTKNAQAPPVFFQCSDVQIV